VRSLPTAHCWPPHPVTGPSSCGRWQPDLTGHTNLVNCVLFKPDGKHIISASFDMTARLWDIASGKQLNTLLLPGQGSSVALSASGTLLAVGCTEGMVALFDVTTGYTLLTTFSAHLGSSSAWFGLCFSPVCGSLLLATCSRMDSTATVWDLSTAVVAAAGAEPTPVAVLQGHTKVISDVRLSGDGTLIATASDDNTVRVWDAVTGQELHKLTDTPTRCTV